MIDVEFWRRVVSEIRRQLQYTAYRGAPIQVIEPQTESERTYWAARKPAPEKVN